MSRISAVTLTWMVMAAALAVAADCSSGSSSTGIDAASTNDARTGPQGDADVTGGSPCSATVACGAGQVCDNATRTCVECLATSDCGTQKCDTTSHTCVDCLSNADCPAATPSCSSSHACSVTCGSNADCPMAMPICQSARRACVECVTAADCGAGRTCQPDLTCE